MNILITKKETEQLKGLAILMIIVQHWSQSFGISIVNPLGPIGVCLFLFLSGYGLTFSFLNNGREHYVSKRLSKVYMPYFLTVILFLVWKYISTGQAVGILQILRFMLLIDYLQGSYWFLAMILLWYIAFYFLTYIFNHRKLLVVLLFAVSLSICILMRGNRLFIWQLFSFPAGIVCQLYQERIADLMKKIMNIYGFCGLLAVAIVSMIIKKTPYVEMHEQGIADTVLQIIITIDVTIVILLINKLLEKNEIYCKVTAFIGGISYECYLAHALPLDSLDGSIKNLILYFIVAIIVFVILMAERRLRNKLKKSK